MATADLGHAATGSLDETSGPTRTGVDAHLRAPRLNAFPGMTRGSGLPRMRARAKPSNLPQSGGRKEGM